MEKTKVSALLKKLIDIPSITGDEAAVGNFLAQYLEKAGFEVMRMPVAGERINVFAKVGQPKIILQAHMDVVPPHLEAREDEAFIYGRGSCDTKGSIASMMVAAQNALSQGVSDFGLLFTVGEEVDFSGAKQAQSFMEDLDAFLIVGEPTELKPVVAHFGILVFSLVCTGKAAHSSEPDRGENAIDKLVLLLSDSVKKLKLHPGTLMSIVSLSGGRADNIIPDRAEALLSFRIAPGDNNNYAEQMQSLVGSQGVVEATQSLPPVASVVPKSLAFFGKGEQVKYCTELTFLKKGFVYGPGAIADAHTSGERVKKADLEAAVIMYERALKEYQQ